MMSFSEKILAARTELGMTQKQLAEAADLSIRTIFAYEKGEKNPRVGTILRLAKALKVSTRFLSDDECINPVEDIEKDTYIEQARDRHTSNSMRDPDSLMEEIKALFASSKLTQEQKDAFFQTIMTAYVSCKEKAKPNA